MSQPVTKVLLVSHHYPPHIGGLELVVRRQAQDLARHGYDASVLTSLWPPALPRELEDGVEIIRVSASHVLENRFFVPFPLFSPLFLLRAWKRTKTADIIHIHDVFYLSSWIAAICAAIARKPMLLTQHVAMVEHSSRLVMLAQRLIYASMGRWMFKRARRVIAYNHNVRDFLRAHRVEERRILFMTNGINTEVFRPPISGEREAIRNKYCLPLDRPLVLFVGRLVDKKGVRVLLDSKHEQFDLVFVGPGPIPRHGSKEGVHWLGPMNQESTAEMYRACDIFAFPAVGEIYTLAMQEAMASALPVVTTDETAYVGAAPAEGIVLCPRHPFHFREAILELLSDRERRDSLGAKCRGTAIRYFNWDLNFSGMIDAYVEAIS